MFSRLDIFDKRYNELEKRMYEPDVVSDPETYRKVMQEYPQIQSSLRIAERVPFDDLPELSRCIREAKQDLGDAGRVIVRYSGTENKLRILAEARTESAARLWHDKIAGVAARELEVIS